MPSKPKIKIIDNRELRLEIDKLYEESEQIILAKWALNCAKHILPLSQFEKIEMTDIENGIRTNELWQIG